jgi:hypothetical protein
MGQINNSAHKNRAFIIMKKKRPTSWPKVGAATTDGKPLFSAARLPAFAGPWLYVPGLPRVCPFAEVVLFSFSLCEKK